MVSPALVSKETYKQALIDTVNNSGRCPAIHNHVLTEDEAKDMIVRYGRLEIRINVSTNAFFFVSNYCFGEGVMGSDWVGIAHSVPKRHVGREAAAKIGKSSIDTLEDFIKVYHPDGHFIQGLDELVDYVYRL